MALIGLAVPPSRSDSSSAVVTAIICAGSGHRAVRRGQGCARRAVSRPGSTSPSLPAMVIATSIFSIVLVAVNAKGVSRLSPARFVPWAFAVSAVLLIFEWRLTSRSPTLAAVLVYLHISGTRPDSRLGVLADRHASASTRARPREASGRSPAAARSAACSAACWPNASPCLLGVGAMLPVLAMLNLVCAWQVRRLRRPRHRARQSDRVLARARRRSRHGRACACSPKPRTCGTSRCSCCSAPTSAALIDYALQGAGGRRLGPGKPAQILRRLLRGHQPRHLRRSRRRRAGWRSRGWGWPSPRPRRRSRCLPAVSAHWRRRDSRARSSRAAASRCSAARCSARATRCSTRRFRLGEKRAAKSIIDVGFDRSATPSAAGAIRSSSCWRRGAARRRSWPRRSSAGCRQRSSPAG